MLVSHFTILIVTVILLCVRGSSWHTVCCYCHDLLLTKLRLLLKLGTCWASDWVAFSISLQRYSYVPHWHATVTVTWRI